MNKIKKMVSNYGIFIIILLGILFCLWKRDSYLEAPIVSCPDLGIRYSTQDGILEQTWQPHVKKITGISIPYTAENNFEADMVLRVYTDDKSTLLIEKYFSHKFVEEESGEIQITFAPIRVALGERIRIQLSFERVSENGTILIPAGSNYMGASINNEECNIALAFKITFIKSSRLFWLFSVILPLFAFSAISMVIFRRKWEEVIGLSISVCGLILYSCGLMGKLQVGITLIYILAGFALIGFVIIYIKNRMCLYDLISPGLIIWLIMFGLIMLNCNGLWLARSDEYTHWGLAVKDMFYFDSLAKHIDTTVIAIRYMPFSTLIEYFVVYVNKFFSVELIYIGFQLTLLCYASIVLQCTKKNWKYTIPSIATIVLVPVIFFYDVSNCLYVDPLLAIIAAYILICYYVENSNVFNWIRIMGGIFALVTTKDVGVAIAGLIGVIMLCDCIYRKGVLQKELKIQSMIMPLASIVLAIVFFLSWQMYLSTPIVNAVEENRAENEIKNDYVAQDDIEYVEVTNENMKNIEEPTSQPTVEEVASENTVEEPTVEEVASESTVEEPTVEEEVRESTVEGPTSQTTVAASGVSINKLLDIIRGRGESYHYKSIRAFIVELFDGDTFDLGIVSVSYMEMFLLILFFMLVGGYLNWWQEDKYLYYSFGVLSIVGGIGYAIFLEILYLCAFGKSEAMSLASHERYLGTFAGAIFLVFCYLIIYKISNRNMENNKALSFSLVLTIVLLVISPVSNFINLNKHFSITDETIYGYDVLEEVMRSFANKGEKFYFICSNSKGGSLRMFQNSACPMLVPYFEGDIAANNTYLAEQEAEYALYGVVMNPKTMMPVEEWQDRLSNCHYVFLLNVDKMFKNSYQGIFEYPDLVNNGTIYKVSKDTDQISLKYIGQVGFMSYLK